jgi:hypothetical protein
VLKSVNARARQCHEWASKARRRALETTDPISRTEYLAAETRWLKLENSYELSERLTDVLNRPAALPKHPECPNCHVPMWLVEIQSSSEKVEYLYECKACENKMSVMDDEENSWEYTN